MAGWDLVPSQGPMTQDQSIVERSPSEDELPWTHLLGDTMLNISHIEVFSGHCLQQPLDRDAFLGLWRRTSFRWEEPCDDISPSLLFKGSPSCLSKPARRQTLGAARRLRSLQSTGVGGRGGGLVPSPGSASPGGASVRPRRRLSPGGRPMWVPRPSDPSHSADYDCFFPEMVARGIRSSI